MLAKPGDEVTASETMPRLVTKALSGKTPIIVGDDGRLVVGFDLRCGGEARKQFDASRNGVVL